MRLDTESRVSEYSSGWIISPVWGVFHNEAGERPASPGWWNKRIGGSQEERQERSEYIKKIRFG